MGKKSQRKRKNKPLQECAIEKTEFEEIKFWHNLSNVPEFEEIRKDYLSEFEENQISLIRQCFDYAREVYKDIPQRKNGETSFVHPVNVMIYLAKARADYLTICSGILHDVVEEQVDISLKDLKQKRLKQLSLSALEKRIESEFTIKLQSICETAETGMADAKKIADAVFLLTRQKKHRYYKSISQIYNCKDAETRFRAITVKLADRMHNVQTIENYSDENKLYQCFKNMFILNNTKRVLAKEAAGITKELEYSIEKLFKKNGKATAQALLRIEERCVEELKSKNLVDVADYFWFGLGKYILEIEGLEKVTQPLTAGRHFSDVYHGTVIKYDHRLHYDAERYKEAVARELDFCKKMFKEINLGISETKRAIEYKDSIALLEVVKYLLYAEGYYIHGFECSKLCSRGRLCMRDK